MSTVFRFDIITAALLLTLIINIVFGLIVYSRDTKNQTNRSFFLFTLTVTGWTIGMILYRGFLNVYWAVLFCRLLYVSAVLIPFALLRFGINFPSETSQITKWQKYLLPIPALILVLFSILPGQLIQTVILFPHGENVIVFNFFLELCYVFYISGYFLYYFWVLGRKFSHTYPDGVVHQQLFYLILGTFVSATIGVVSNLLLVMLGVFTFNWLGQVGLLFMVLLISFAILRYHLFDAKIISTELLVAGLWIFILIRIFVSASPTDQIINIFFLFAALITGGLLVMSVKKEVQLREELERANAGQENIIHIMNHQIKGHLSVMKDIFAEMLTNDYGVLPASVKPLAQKGLDEANAGVRYATEVLKGASAENGSLQYDMENIDLSSLVLEATQKEKGIAEAKGLTFIFHKEADDYHMFGDIAHLTEAMRNVIENAINYTPSGSITIDLSRKNNRALLSVHDTGVGIREEDKTKLFKAGGTAKNSIKINTNSSGYGLVFVRAVVEAHKGKVWFESAGESKGTTFFVELPLA